MKKDTQGLMEPPRSTSTIRAALKGMQRQSDSRDHTIAIEDVHQSDNL